MPSLLCPHSLAVVGITVAVGVTPLAAQVATAPIVLQVRAHRAVHGVKVVQSNRPDLFDNFLIVSPATYWNSSEVLGMGVFQDAVEPKRNQIFLASGGGEMSVMRRSADSLAQALGSLSSTEFKRVEYEGADHLTVLPRALLDGLIYLFGR